ncbi:unnamed protein product [Mesocestoides corti]|uniref:Uncharacterized protein n=2 Tax=Mesocestoides corti TaxID=53468 RepID=A0A0R3U1Q9_MESCO|nr:unnamed protein product [Mesocestoides corti]
MFPQHRKEKESDGGASPDPAESASKLKVSPPSSPSVHAEGGGDIRPVDVLHANPERAGKRAMSPPCSSSVPVGGGNKSDSGNISPGPFEEAKKIKIEDFGTSKSLGVLQCPSATKYEDESSLSAKSTITSLGFSKTSEEKQQQKPSPPSESSFVPTRSEASSSSARSSFAFSALKIDDETESVSYCRFFDALLYRLAALQLPVCLITLEVGPVAKDASQPTVFKPPDFLHDDSKPPSLHSVAWPGYPGRCSLEFYPVPKAIFVLLNYPYGFPMLTPAYLGRLPNRWHNIFLQMSARLIHRALALRYKMTVTNIPLEPFPGISVEVFHSQSFFESTGPLLIIIQGGTFSTAGVWEPDHLLQSGVGRFAKGLESGSQIRLAEMAHALGYALAIINLNSVVDRRPLPEDLDPETESVAVCELLPVASAPSSTNSSTVLRRRQARICLSEFPIIPQPMCHVELEERLVCVWLHLMKRCASQQICVWAHQMAAAYFLYPLRPFPCEWRTGAHPGVATASDLPSQLSTKVPNPSPSPHKCKLPSQVSPPSDVASSGEVTGRPRRHASAESLCTQSVSELTRDFPEFCRPIGDPVSSYPPSFGESDMGSDYAATNQELLNDDKIRRSTVAGWHKRALSYWSSIRERVKGLVFTDASSVSTNLGLQRVGWGLVAPEESHQIPLGSELPPAVSGVRRWFKDNAIHFVASPRPLGRRVEYNKYRPAAIPMYSSGTIDHDLVHSAALTPALAYFERRLRKLGTQVKDAPTKSGEQPAGTSKA